MALVAKTGYGVVLLGATLAAGGALALSREAQEYVEIQTRIAPDQCALQKLSAQATIANREGNQGKRQELNAQMAPIAKRIQAYQPRIQELAKSVPSSSPDYQAVIQQMQDLQAKCKL
jgi:hypothetical protein